MLLLFIISCVLISLLAVTAMYLDSKNMLPWQDGPRAINSTAGLSWPAKELVKEFNALPVDNRPTFDIIGIVRALDVKYMDDTDNRRHFFEYEYGNKWSNCRCGSHYRCEFKEYVDLHEKMEDIQRAVKQRVKALEMFRVQHELNEAEALAEALDEEAVNIEEVTRELA